MAEDIGKIINNGFGTYTRNLNICIPFILNFFVSGLLALLIIIFGFVYIFAPSLSDVENVKSPEAAASILLPLISGHIMEIVILAILILLVVFFIQAYFTSGAIGMAIQATDSGRSSLSTMTDAGKKNLVNMFLAEILFGLLSLAGIVFIVPGAMKIDISQISNPGNTGSYALFFSGFLLWVAYLVILSIILAVFKYALVADNIGPIESMIAAVSFFKKNKSDVLLLFLIILLISIFYVIIDQVMGGIAIINIIWGFINIFISLVVIPPLTTIWWVRLYLARTGRHLYFDDLLAHPNELNHL